MSFSRNISSSATLSDLGGILGGFLTLKHPLEVTTELSQGRDHPYLKDIDKKQLFGKFQKNLRRGFLAICINMQFLAYFGYFAPFWTVKWPYTGHRSFPEKFLLLLFAHYHIEHLCKISEKSEARFLR